MPNPVLRLRRQAHRLTVLAVTGLAGCVTVVDPKAPQDPVGAALAQPFRDLGLIQGQLPAGLRQVAVEPYRPLRDCPAVRAGLAELKGWLGADIDVAGPRGENGAAGLAGDVVTGAASLPFRSLVRRPSGAHKRDRNVAAVILGGMVRRGFLKGQRAALSCPVDGA